MRRLQVGLGALLLLVLVPAMAFAQASITGVVKDASGAFPPLQLAATGALFIATNVKVSSVYPKRQSTFLLTVRIRASGRTGTSSVAMSQRWLAKLHCDGM